MLFSFGMVPPRIREFLALRSAIPDVTLITRQLFEENKTRKRVGQSFTYLSRFVTFFDCKVNALFLKYHWFILTNPLYYDIIIPTICMIFNNQFFQ